MKFILLDFDGVMIPAKNWQPVPMSHDGFLEFSFKAMQQLDWLLMRTGATIVLTTTHRKVLDITKWKSIFSNRFAHFTDIAVMDTDLENRLLMVTDWANRHGNDNKFVVIDDDTTLDDLPGPIKRHWVKTKPMIGLNEEDAAKALQILLD